jgi:hypothetical protein
MLPPIQTLQKVLGTNNKLDEAQQYMNVVCIQKFRKKQSKKDMFFHQRVQLYEYNIQNLKGYTAHKIERNVSRSIDWNC